MVADWSYWGLETRVSQVESGYPSGGWGLDVSPLYLSVQPLFSGAGGTMEDASIYRGYENSYLVHRSFLEKRSSLNILSVGSKPN